MSKCKTLLLINFLAPLIIADPTLHTVQDNDLDGWVAEIKNGATYGGAGSSANSTVYSII